jgi:hypothetical protein
LVLRGYFIVFRASAPNATEPCKSQFLGRLPIAKQPIASVHSADFLCDLCVRLSARNRRIAEIAENFCRVR